MLRAYTKSAGYYRTRTLPPKPKAKTKAKTRAKIPPVSALLWNLKMPPTLTSNRGALPHTPPGPVAAPDPRAWERSSQTVLAGELRARAPSSHSRGRYPNQPPRKTLCRLLWHRAEQTDALKDHMARLATQDNVLSLKTEMPSLDYLDYVMNVQLSPLALRT